MVIRRGIRAFRADQSGAVLVEALIVMNVVLLMLVAFIELTIAVNQWNMAVKSLQVGARLAAVSHPVDSSLSGYEYVGLPGDPPQPPFETRVCSGETTTCTPGAYDEDAMERILVRMRQIFPRMEAENLRITYSWAGLGYVGRPSGPVAVINLTMQDVAFDFLLLGLFIGPNTLPMPEFSVTAVTEDLSTTFIQ